MRHVEFSPGVTPPHTSRFGDQDGAAPVRVQARGMLHHLLAPRRRVGWCVDNVATRNIFDFLVSHNVLIEWS